MEPQSGFIINPTILLVFYLFMCSFPPIQYTFLCDYATLGSFLGFSTKLRIWQVPTFKMKLQIFLCVTWSPVELSIYFNLYLRAELVLYIDKLSKSPFSTWTQGFNAKVGFGNLHRVLRYRQNVSKFSFSSKMSKITHGVKSKFGMLNSYILTDYQASH